MLTKYDLVRSAANFRHGVVLPSRVVENLPSDINNFFNVGVPQNSEEPWKSASGGVGRDLETSELAAIGEALERYSSFACQVPRATLSELKGKEVLNLEGFSLFSEGQINEKEFPYKNLYSDQLSYTNVFSLYDNKEYWAPSDLVTLSNTHDSAISSSSGLAAGQSIYQALLRALQEVLERDAFMITWLHCVQGKRLKLDNRYLDEVYGKNGEVGCYDITQDFSPFPTAMVSGYIPVRGRNRYSVGCACRETWEEAVEKAYLEWAQGVAFTSYYYSFHPELSFKGYRDVLTFDDHAIYYTVYPEEWKKIPLFKGKTESNNKRSSKELTGSSAEVLQKSLLALKKAGIRLYYRDLTSQDLKQIGLSAVRVLCPDLTPIYHDTRYPFLGGTAKDIFWRYPWAKSQKLKFPNPLPHPLG